VTSAIESVPPVLAYLIIAALVFGEAAIFIGFVLPGETAVLLGGFLASTGHLNIWVVCVLVVVSAVVGDTVGYEVGRVFGPRIVRSRLFHKHEARLDSARRMLRERGGPAVFLGRFTAFFRAVMPGLAGTSRMPYPRFLAFNAAGAVVWGGGVAVLGYFAGTSYAAAERALGPGCAALPAVFLVLGVLAWRRYRLP